MVKLVGLEVEEVLEQHLLDDVESEVGLKDRLEKDCDPRSCEVCLEDLVQVVFLEQQVEQPLESGPGEV